MIVAALLVTHDGGRWLPAVLEGLAEQHRPVDRFIAVDTGSSDDSPRLVASAWGADALVQLERKVSYPDAVAAGLAGLAASASPGEDEWVWLLHDDARPAPGALAALVAAAEAYPQAAIFGPKLREWPSLRRLVEMGLTISGTGRRETGLERGEYDQGQHDDVRRVLAVNTAGMLVRRRVLEDLGGLDPQLPVFGNDLDFGWRAARAGHTSLVIPDAVMFHAEAASVGLRSTSWSSTSWNGANAHASLRRAAIYTLLVNCATVRLPWQALRLLAGSMVRALGFLLVRSPGEAADEIIAVAWVYARPGRIIAARRERAARERQAGQQADPAAVRRLLAPWWLPYRHGLDAVTDALQAVTNQASDVAERRHLTRLETDPAYAREVAARVRRDEKFRDDDEAAYLRDTGAVARFVTNPIALTMAVIVGVSLVAARTAWGAVVGGALSPAPDSSADWWRLYLESWHPLGMGTDVPAPAYVLPFAGLASLPGSSPGLVISMVFLLAVPMALWGAWRLLRVVGHLVDPGGLPRWLLGWGSLTWSLVPVTSGAWSGGRFGVVVVAALLPWAVHAALGFVDPEADRRWRAAWRCALLLALASAFVPAVWLAALLIAVVVLATAVAIVPEVRHRRSLWGPPVVAVGAVPVLLAPWLVPLIATGSTAGLLLEAGRLPVDQVGPLGLLTGRLAELSSPHVAPWWLGAGVGLLAVLALLPRPNRVPVLACWLVGVAVAVVALGLSYIQLQLPAALARPSFGFSVLLLQGVAIVAAVLGGDAFLRRLQAHHPGWQRALAGLLAVGAALVPLGGLAWWVLHPQQDLDDEADADIPAYMQQSSRQGIERGVLVLDGSIDEGVDYLIRRGDGMTVGEDEIVLLSQEDADFRDVVRRLVTAPTPDLVGDLAASGIEYVVLPEPADGTIAAGLDATAGLDQASAENRGTRAWKIDQVPDAAALEGPGTWSRPILLVVQGVAIASALVLSLPRLRPDRGGSA